VRIKKRGKKRSNLSLFCSVKHKHTCDIHKRSHLSLSLFFSFRPRKRRREEEGERRKKKKKYRERKGASMTKKNRGFDPLRLGGANGKKESSLLQTRRRPFLRFEVGERLEFSCFVGDNFEEEHQITGRVVGVHVKCNNVNCEVVHPYKAEVDEEFRALLGYKFYLIRDDTNESCRLENTGCYKSKRRPKLRFEVGQRVQARVVSFSDPTSNTWETGTIVEHWTRPPGFDISDGCALPYKIRIHDVSKNDVRDGADFVCADFDADSCVREEVRATIGPPTTLATLLLEIPDLFENEIIWRLTTGDLKRFALSSKKCYERVKRSFNTYEFEDLTLEKLQEGPSPLMDLFEKEENKDLLAKVVSFLNPTDVKFACLATKTMLTGLKGTGWQVSSHRNGTFPDSRVMTPDHGVWFIHEFSSVTTLKKFFERFFDPEIYANTGRIFDSVWVGLCVIGRMELVDWWRNEKICAENNWNWHPVAPIIARQEGHEEFAKALIDRGCSDGPIPERFRCCMNCPRAAYHLTATDDSDEEEESEEEE
jgi:hypothetical protein